MVYSSLKSNCSLGKKGYELKKKTNPALPYKEQYLEAFSPDRRCIRDIELLFLLPESLLNNPAITRMVLFAKSVFRLSAMTELTGVRVFVLRTGRNEKKPTLLFILSCEGLTIFFFLLNALSIWFWRQVNFFLE